MKTMSIAIPTHSFNGRGTEVVEHAFNRMAIQTFKDFEVCISDHSIDDNIKNLCERWKDRLDINYFKNIEDRGNAASNHNKVIKMCSGKLIKFMCSDDLLFDQNSLQIIINNFNDYDLWLFSAYVHSYDRVNYFNYYVPYMNNSIATCNTLGTPSAITFRNIELPLFDVNLKACFDCDMYWRMIKMYGIPKIIKDVTMINYLWEESGTSTIDRGIFDRETLYILEKIGNYEK